MIVLPIHSQEDDDTPQEWSLLELNGELLTPKNEPEGDSMELGKVNFDSEGTPIMTIAAHELKGKIQPLKQPFVIMRSLKRCGDSAVVNGERFSKRCKAIDEDESNEMEVDQKGGYEIAGVVKSKILFDRYPKSIMR